MLSPSLSLENLHGHFAFLQKTFRELAPTVVPEVLPYEKKQVSFERHPLQTLYHLAQRSFETESSSRLRELLDAIPKPLSTSLFFEVWSQATDPTKGGEKWGELHTLDDPQRLLNVITTVVKQRWESLSVEKKGAVLKTLSRIAHPVQLQQIDQDPEKWIQALHRNQCLDIPGKELAICPSLEKGATAPSQFFDLGRPELARGQIRFQNGMANSLDDAKAHAIKISDLAGGVNVHCVYSPTAGIARDLFTAASGQAGVLPPSILNILEGWVDFFESHEEDRLLQICHSRGAIDVNNALKQLPEHLKQRVIVVALAPGDIIGPNQAYQVRNLINHFDPVPHLATGREHLSSGEHTLLFDMHNDTLNPHSPHGSNFSEGLRAICDTYIRTNTITTS